MTDTSLPRELLKQAPAEILAKLPSMGRVMLSARAAGATHERMGVVEKVQLEGDFARLSGAMHDSALDLTVITRLVADRTSKMRERVLPRLECQNAEGEVLFSLIGLDGLEPFDQALAGFGPGEALEPVAREAGMGGAQDVPDDDLGAATFAAILRNGTPIAIELRRPGLHQLWSGALPEPKPAMEPDRFDRFIRAQQTWDRAFACGIADYLAATPGDPLVIGIIGRGHLEYGHGTPYQLRDLGIEEIAVLLPTDRASHEAASLKGIADAIFRLDTPEPPSPRRRVPGTPA